MLHDSLHKPTAAKFNFVSAVVAFTSSITKRSQGSGVLQLISLHRFALFLVELMHYVLHHIARLHLQCFRYFLLIHSTLPSNIRMKINM